MKNRRHLLALCALSLGALAAPLAGEASEPRGRRQRAGETSFEQSLVRPQRSARIPAAGPTDLGGTCGDSVLDTGEQCDDGNALPGDGCSDTCQIEAGYACTAPIPAASGSNIVLDPSFEDGTPNPSWTEASDNFGTPLCNLVDCGDGGGGFGPRTGDWWAWFGGCDPGDECGLPETSSLSQSLVIPVGATTLEFQLELFVCDSADDVLEVTIDGTSPPLFTINGASPLCGMSGYSAQSVNVSGFADGGSHTLQFDGETVSTNGGVTNFFLDDVVISDNVPLPPVPSDCFLVGPLDCDGSLVDFDHPSTGIPGDWSVIDNESSGVVWTTIAGSGELGNFTGGTGEAATVSSRLNAGEFDTELRAPFDLSVISAGARARLTYRANYQNKTASDFLDLEISSDGGSNWTPLLSWNEDHGNFLSALGEEVTVDLSGFAGMGGLLLRWRYYAPGMGDDAWYAQIDEAKLTCDPVIQVTPPSLATTQFQGTRDTRSLTVANIGFGDLDWTILEASSDCAATSDVTWLSASPAGGTTGTGLSTPVTVTMDASGVATGIHQAKLCIDSNDPATPRVEVPVTMTVEACVTSGDCDDDNTCTDDSCVPATGCSYANNSASCDDDDICTTADMCSAGSCVGSPPVDDLVLDNRTLTGGQWVARVSITGGPGLVIDGAVEFIAGSSISFVSDVEIGDGFSAEIVPGLCP